MSAWNEDNYWERIMPLLQRDLGPDWCPDTSVLSAVAVGETDDALKTAIFAHIAKCSTCEDFYRRLDDFGKATIPENDLSWIEIEKRLDNWLRDFFSSRGAVAVGQPTKAESLRHVFGRKDLIKSLLYLKKQWALGIAAAILIVVSGTYLIKLVAPSHRVQITTHGDPLQSHSHMEDPLLAKSYTQNAEPVNGVKQRLIQARRQTSPVIQNDPAKQGVFHITDDAAGPKNPATPQSVDPSVAEPYGTTKIAEAAQSSGLSNSEKSETLSSVKATPPNQREPATESARVDTPSMSSAQVKSNAIHPAQTLTSSLSASPYKVPKPALSTGAGVAAVLPSSFRIESGTRIWILLKSTIIQAKGTFKFRGTTLLPVTQSGRVMIERDAEIQGAGSLSNGRTSLRIDELVLRGAHYRLSSLNDAAGMRKPGTGAAVQFDSGQVMEMWMGSASVYEKIVAGTGESKK